MGYDYRRIGLASRTCKHFLDYVDENGGRRRVSLGHANKRRAELQRAQKERELRSGISTLHTLQIRYNSVRNRSVREETTMTPNPETRSLSSILERKGVDRTIKTKTVVFSVIFAVVAGIWGCGAPQPEPICRPGLSGSLSGPPAALTTQVWISQMPG